MYTAGPLCTVPQPARPAQPTNIAPTRVSLSVLTPHRSVNLNLPRCHSFTKMMLDYEIGNHMIIQEAIRRCYGSVIIMSSDQPIPPAGMWT